MLDNKKIRALTYAAESLSNALDQYRKVKTGDQRSYDLAENAAKAWEKVAEAIEELIESY